MQQYDYDVVIASDIGALANATNKALSEHYKLGGFAVSVVDGVEVFYQIVYKERAWPQP